MSTRPLQILQRFPAHLEAARPGKQLGEAVAALAGGLDLLSSDLAGVRRAHRLADADTLRDLLLLGGLHGIDRTQLDLLFLRVAKVLALAQALEDAVTAGDTAERDAQAQALFELWGTETPGALLPRYAPPAQPANLNAAATALAAAARRSVTFRKVLDAARERVREICRIHGNGNITVGSLLEAATNALDLEVDTARNAQVLAQIREAGSTTLDLTRTDGYFHSLDRYRHVTFVKDRLRPEPVPRGGNLPPLPLPYAEEIVGVEENPLRREERDLGPRPHADLFSVSRRGFSQAELEVRIEGLGDHTVGPHLVNRDEGCGFGFAGSVPDGKQLVLTEEGTLRLDGVDVTDRGYSWKGACFADATAPHTRDFVFAGPGLAEGARPLTFAVATPPGTLDRDAVFPHPAVSLEVPGIGVGDTRFAFFVQEAHLSLRQGTAPAFTVRRVTPYFAIGFADRSVFAPPPNPHPDAAKLKLAWREHQSYVVRVSIPPRFDALDTPEATALERVARALERFRSAGVLIETKLLDDSWILGTGVLPLPEGDPTLRILGGTVVSPVPPAS
ncbi:hypothetical protein [Pyxidicoccus trucidator]|uniref:hypothetical protein n=1 Tax=Pyxidicoccus trucidator TaxID=2709662 RepID=UPI0013D97192|nr:hypothetical protein [Pyxidicoccus trucidator]